MKPEFKTSDLIKTYWRMENLSPPPPTTRRSLTYQFVFYCVSLNEPLGTVRRLPEGTYHTTWRFENSTLNKQHHTLEGAKGFLKRKFFRTVAPRLYLK